MYIMSEDYLWMKVSLKDIYYFETIKSSHYCKVVHKDGTGKIHADVKPLYEKVAPYFFSDKIIYAGESGSGPESRYQKPDSLF